VEAEASVLGNYDGGGRWAVQVDEFVQCIMQVVLVGPNLGQKLEVLVVERQYGASKGKGPWRGVPPARTSWRGHPR
jgi:hypothetical protein